MSEPAIREFVRLDLPATEAGFRHLAAFAIEVGPLDIYGCALLQRNDRYHVAFPKPKDAGLGHPIRFRSREAERAFTDRVLARYRLARPKDAA